MDDASSNFRELRNLVDSLVELATTENLQGSEIFLVTDNSTAEAAFFNGASTNEILHNLILELRCLEKASCLRLHLIHVAGTRMICQGSDGLSRGNLTEGVMSGTDMLSFIPIQLNALERSLSLKEWLLSWTDPDLEFLDPEGWFERGHGIVPGCMDTNSDGFPIPKYQSGTFVWSPPPVIADVVMEQVHDSRHKCHNSTHIILIPWLMTPSWRKALHKVADIVLSLPAGHPAWPSSMHEPLTIALIFPFLRTAPWQLRRQPFLLGVEWALQEVWKNNHSSERPILCQLWNLPSKLACLSEKLARKMLQSKFRSPLSDSTTGERRGS